MVRVTVQDIHNDFNDYPKHLVGILQDMDMNLKEEDRKYKKLKEMEALGFSKIAEDVEDPTKVFKYSKKEFDTLSDMYLEYYGRYKFISKRGVENLCKKYNLFHGRIQNFTAGIPEKNMDDILKSSEEPFGYTNMLTCEFNGRQFSFMGNIANDPSQLITPNMLGFNDLMDIDIRILDSRGNTIVQENKSNHRAMSQEMQFESLRSQSIRISDPSRQFSLLGGISDMMNSNVRTDRDGRDRQAGNLRPSMNDKLLDSYKSELLRSIKNAMDRAQSEVDETIYSIVANHADFSKLESVDTKKLTVDIPELRFPDPIVLKKTKHDEVYAIITAWDKEASDPLVVNQGMN